MTPFVVFEKELEDLGWSLNTIPGDINGHCHRDTKTICLGTRLTADEAGIVGLHELGHARTGRFWGSRDPFEQYEDEVRAWEWAIERVPAGYDGLLCQLMAFGLNSHNPYLRVSQRQAPLISAIVVVAR